VDLDKLLEPIINFIQNKTHVDIKFMQGEFGKFARTGLLVKYVIPLIIFYIMGGLAYISMDAGVYRWRSYKSDSVLSFISKRNKRKKRMEYLKKVWNWLVKSISPKKPEPPQPIKKKRGRPRKNPS
jgi:hypothetical protein